ALFIKSHIHLIGHHKAAGVFPYPPVSLFLHDRRTEQHDHVHQAFARGKASYYYKDSPYVQSCFKIQKSGKKNKKGHGEQNGGDDDAPLPLRPYISVISFADFTFVRWSAHEISLLFLLFSVNISDCFLFS